MTTICFEDALSLLQRCARLSGAVSPPVSSSSTGPRRLPLVIHGVGVSTSRVVLPAPAPFCLHPHVTTSAAGSMCRECGVVVGLESVSHGTGPPVDGANRRQPVVDLRVHHDGNVTSSSDVVPPDPATTARHRSATAPTTPAVVARQHCLHEWHTHAAAIRDQPQEVMDRAFDIFRRVYEQQPVTGNKARALILVGLLYASRLLHGSNPHNEQYLLGSLRIPTRVMNKAFSSLATVVHLPATMPAAPCSGDSMRS